MPVAEDDEEDAAASAEAEDVSEVEAAVEEAPEVEEASEAEPVGAALDVEPSDETGEETDAKPAG